MLATRLTTTRGVGEPDPLSPVAISHLFCFWHALIQFRKTDVMNKSTYRYRAVHRIFEKLLALSAPLVPRANGQPLRELPRKLLVLKFGGMGEAVLARSLVERLQERHPSITFDFLVEKRTVETMTIGRSGSVLMYSPGTDGIPKALSILKEIRSRRYDAVLDFEQHSLLTAAFTRATAIPVRIGFLPSKSNARSQMFTHSIQLQEGELMWSAFVRLGRVLDPELPVPLMTVPLPVSEEAETWFQKWWNANVRVGKRGPVVAMHLGVGPSAQYRRWPAERFADLAVALTKIHPEIIVVLTGAKGERSLFDDFRRRFAGTTIDAADLGGLDRTGALLRHCDLLISGDTGIMHLAAAMGTPTVGLFGPNTPACWAPVGPHAASVYRTYQPCTPCINSYRRHIPEKCIATQESACMWDITIHDVLNAARSVVQGSWLL